MQFADTELKALLPQMSISTPAYAAPFDPANQIQPASIDLRVDRIVWKRQRLPLPRTIDLTNRLGAGLSSALSKRYTYKVDVGPRGTFHLAPGDILMARTLEEFTVPESCSAEIFTRSSFGRLGLSVTCAGYINPGYRGHMPLQIMNLGKETIHFPPLISVCQVVLRKLTSTPERSYGDIDLRSKYANDDGGPSRVWMDEIIKRNQDSLGATNMREEAQRQLLEFMLSRDLSAQLRFEGFLKSAKASDLENAESALDAFAKREWWARIWERAKNAYGAVVLGLITLSAGALFSTPFNETKYGPLHISLWAATVVTGIIYVPIFIRKLTARETDFLLPEDVATVRFDDPEARG